MNRTLEAIARAIFKSWFIDFDPVIDNAILNGKPIPEEFRERAEVRREILARSQPSPPAPLPEVEGEHYRGGFDFSGLVETSRELRKTQTPAEEIMWELLRDRRLMGAKFRRQHQIGDYIADFYCHDHKLVVELDGGVHRTQEAKDAKRDAYLESLGLTVLRFPNDEVLDAVERVLSQIAQAADVASPFGRGGGEGVATCRDLFPDSFQDSPLGKIPKGWEVAVLGNVAARRQETVKPESIEDETPYVALDDMPRESIALSSWKHAEGIASSKSRFRKGDVLFGKLRPYFHKVVAAPTDGVCSTDIVVVRAKQEKWSAFLLMLCSSKEFVAYNSAVMTGTKMPRTNWKDMSKYELACPPDAIVEAYEAATLPLIQQIVASIHECRQLSSVRETLLAPLLSGEVVMRDNSAQRDYQ
ncbi:DUF559 domain-containing protein [Candidatus Bipolaricaulota bacterium]|nr:DUF559 domain-containing protein [Candidatus Bipolaricaulota bacterium]